MNDTRVEALTEEWTTQINFSDHPCIPSEGHGPLGTPGGITGSIALSDDWSTRWRENQKEHVILNAVTRGKGCLQKSKRTLEVNRKTVI